MAEFESLFFSTWDDFPWNGPNDINFSCLFIKLFVKYAEYQYYDIRYVVGKFADPPSVGKSWHRLKTKYCYFNSCVEMFQSILQPQNITKQ